MVPNYRSAKIIVDVAPELKAALKAEAKARSGTAGKVTMTDVIREMLVAALGSKISGATS